MLVFLIFYQQLGIVYRLLWDKFCLNGLSHYVIELQTSKLAFHKNIIRYLGHLNTPYVYTSFLWEMQLLRLGRYLMRRTELVTGTEVPRPARAGVMIAARNCHKNKNQLIYVVQGNNTGRYYVLNRYLGTFRTRHCSGQVFCGSGPLPIE